MTSIRRNAGSPAPLQLGVLGRVELRKEGAELRRVLAQPRRLALLTYLTLARPGGFMGRDRLLGVFWPESEESRARAALRQAVRFLRRWMGREVVVGRGDGRLGVDPELLSCDALEFARLLEEGERRGAVSVYRGELLPGLVVSGAPAFDLWLDGERRRLGAAAVEAALALTAEAEEVDALDEAAEWAGRALEIDPTDEAVARRRISLLDRTGNRAAAVTTFEAFARRLREAFDLEPAPETVELLETIRGRSRGRGGAAARARPGPPVGGGREGGSEEGNPETALDPRRVLVRRFQNRTGEGDLDVLGAMAADRIAQGLAALPDIDVVPPMLALGTGPGQDEPTAAAPTGDGNRRRPRGAGAGTVVTGAYYLQGDDVSFQTLVTDVVHDRILEGPGPVAAPVERPLEGLEELSRRLAASLAPSLSPRAGHVRQGAHPPSFEAYRAYMEGLELFIRGRWEAALPHFRQAADAEPGYALPRIVCAIAHWNLGHLTEAERVAGEASRLRHGVGRFEGAVLDMVLAWLRGDWAAAHLAAGIQAEIAPGSIPHFQVAEEARRLNRPREARAVLSGLDPERGELAGWIFFWIELCTSHHLLGDHGRELTAARRARELHPDHPVAALLEVRALAAGGRIDALVGRLDDILATPGRREPRPGTLLREAALELRAHGHPGPADELLERAVRWYVERTHGTDPPDLRRDRARTLYHAGRWEEAGTIFRSLADEGPPGVAPVGFHHGHLQGHLDAGYLALVAVRLGDEPECDAWRRRLREMEGPYLYGAPWLWLSALAALRDEAERAVSHLRRALAEGLPFGMHLHTEPHLARLRGYAPFDALMRPRG